MLILSRKEKESILVGENIEITVCRVIGGRVKIGLRAPQHVSIRRGELMAPDDIHVEANSAEESATTELTIH
ncbi:MAG: carbon storage regulator [Planctomycetales bacterium]|nr:carbon storage regulator [Planctomycetales bacterium]